MTFVGDSSTNGADRGLLARFILSGCRSGQREHLAHVHGGLLSMGKSKVTIKEV